MKRVVCGLVLWLGTVMVGFAQQPVPQPMLPGFSLQEQADRLNLELVYAEREHKLCKQSMADLWARANTTEVQLKQAQDKLKTLKEKPDAAQKK